MTSVPRWLVKKASRYAVALGACPRRLLASRSAASNPTLRVLMYHHLRRADRDPFSVAPEAFDRQMKWLADRRLAVSLATLEEHVAAAGPVDGVLVTIDDGYRDLRTVGLPILRRHRVPAVAFVSVGRIEERSGSLENSTGEAYLSWTELAELAAAGVTIASHGWDHVSLTALEPSQMISQVTRSRRLLEQRLGVTINAFAYPFGTRSDFNDATRRALSDAGYTVAFTTQHGAVRYGADTLALPRLKVEGGEGMWMFRQVVTGGLDGWGLVDRFLWRLQDSSPVRPHVTNGISL